MTRQDAQVVDLAAYRVQRGAPEAWCRIGQVVDEFATSARQVQRWTTEGTKRPDRPPLERVPGATLKVSRRMRLYRIGKIREWLEGAA